MCNHLEKLGVPSVNSVRDFNRFSAVLFCSSQTLFQLKVALTLYKMFFSFQMRNNENHMIIMCTGTEYRNGLENCLALVWSWTWSHPTSVMVLTLSGLPQSLGLGLGLHLVSGSLVLTTTPCLTDYIWTYFILCSHVKSFSICKALYR